MTSPLENTTAAETTTSAPPKPAEEDEATATETSDATSPSTPSTRTTSTRVPTVTTRSTTAAPSTAAPPTTQTVTQSPTTTAPRIPDEPGDLSATAGTETAGTVEVDGEDFDVVVKGDTVPTDARSGSRALDAWINDGERTSGVWETFTSDEPDEDGWRWAAINQRTGTVVYVR